MLTMTNMMKYLRLVVIFFLLSSAAYAEDAIGRYTPTTFCKEDQGEWSCIEKIEQAWLREIGGKAKRVNDQLILRLQSGRTIIRKNSLKDIEGFWESKGKPNVKYRLYTYLEKTGFYVLHLAYWEGDGYEFISEKDGSSVIIQNPPSFSPDRSMFFVSKSEDIYDEKTEELQIWSIRSGRISKKWSHATESWPSVAALWISNNKIHLYERKWEHGGHPIHVKKLGVLTLSNGRGTLVEEAKGNDQKVK